MATRKIFATKAGASLSLNMKPSSNVMGVLLFFVVGSTLNVLFVFLLQEIYILSSSKLRRRDIVLFGFQSFNDLFGGFLICLSAFRVKVGQYLVQTNNSGLCTISKPYLAPTNCRCLGIASCNSSNYWKY
jgi:hypothetical protein